AERKGGLDHAEGERLRQGLRQLSGRAPVLPPDTVDAADMAELRKKYDNLRKQVWRRDRRAAARPAPSGPDDAAEKDARDALRRVTALAQRWSFIPAKRRAAAAILTTIRNEDADE
ncbi:MAG: hypothetical protein HOV92_04030, partial [Streptomyces sp.]|nr:hypothetical protein [Streptomyces sp.]